MSCIFLLLFTKMVPKLDSKTFFFLGRKLQVWLTTLEVPKIVLNTLGPFSFGSPQCYLPNLPLKVPLQK
jgi:hypothetical protein